MAAVFKMRGRIMMFCAVVLGVSCLTNAQELFASVQAVDFAMVLRISNKLSTAWDSITGKINSLASGLAPQLGPSDDIGEQERLKLLYDINEWADGLASWILPESVRGGLSHFAMGWFRTWLLNCVIYLGSGGIWCYYVYFCFGKEFFGQGGVPTFGDMGEQIFIALKAIPAYALLEAVTAYWVEKGWTKTYARIDEVGLLAYFGHIIPYMIFTEFCVYWTHRLLHDIPWAYRVLHHDHHKYNKADSLSPFAGNAFHPVDGVLQVLPYSLGLFIFPMHYMTHLLFLLSAELWTHNLHDCIDAWIEPLMGSGFHTVHHVIYKDNYGQYLIYFDWLFGTLTAPEDVESRKQTPTKRKTRKSRGANNRHKKSLLAKSSGKS